jgi:hypothetical protein
MQRVRGFSLYDFQFHARSHKKEHYLIVPPYGSRCGPMPSVHLLPRIRNLLKTGKTLPIAAFGRLRHRDLSPILEANEQPTKRQARTV